MNDLVCRVTRSYSDFREVVDEWADKVGKILCYEHPPDDEVKKVHLHLLIQDSPVKEEALKRICNSMFGMQLSGNQDWSWKKCDPTKVDKYVTYMTKGVYAPKFVKSYSPEYLEERLKAWVEPVLGNDKSASSLKYSELDDMESEYIATHDLNNIVISLDLIRSWTMRWYWKKYGQLPIVSQYKRNAGSLFLRLIERQNTRDFGCAIEEIKNLWY